MIRRVGAWVVLALVLCLCAPSHTYAGPSSGRNGGNAGGHSEQSAASSQAGACAAPLRSGATQVTVCPPVVQSGHALTVLVRSRRSAAVTIHLSYPDRTTAAQSATTDGHGAATLTVVVSYSPVSRYATASFTVSVNKGGAGSDTVQGTVRITQAVQAQPRLQMRPEGGDWCGETGRCVVHNDSNVAFRLVGAQPGAQVTITVSYPEDGTTASCPSNALTGKSTASADAGEYDCTLAISVTMPRHGHADASLQVTVTITAENSAAPVTLQKRLWVVAG